MLLSPAGDQGPLLPAVMYLSVPSPHDHCQALTHTRAPCDRGQADFRRSRVCTREKPPEKKSDSGEIDPKTGRQRFSHALFNGLSRHRLRGAAAEASAWAAHHPRVGPTISTAFITTLRQVADPRLRCCHRCCLRRLFCEQGSAAGLCVDLPSRRSMNACGRWLPSLRRSQSRERPSTVRARPPSMAWRCDGVSGDDRGG